MNERFGQVLLTRVSKYSSILPKEAINVNISDLKRLNTRKVGNDSYSFLLSFEYQKVSEERKFIIKIFRDSLDPILHKQSNEKCQRCLKEFQVLGFLKKVKFPAPQALLCETDPHPFGDPFLIMKKEETIQQNTFDAYLFAENLMTLHGLDVARVEAHALSIPMDPYQFARNCIIYLKEYLELYPTHDRDLKRDFEFAIHWLDSKINEQGCLKYSLLHGDYRAKFNTILTEEGKMLVTDWEDAVIGDPIYDLCMAYVRAKMDFGKSSANQFMSKYIDNMTEDISEKVAFYQLVAHLRLAITHSAVLSSPSRAYKIRGGKALLLFPFLSLPLISRNVGTNADIIWIENFKAFVKEYLN